MPLIFGLNHKTAPLAVRERFAMTPAALPEALERLKRDVPVDEAVMLSTCNRFEVYVESKDRTQALDGLHRHIVQGRGTLLAPEHFYTAERGDAVRHLFRVSSGLDSMVLGENEILGQVKQAYQTAQQNGFTGKLLNVLFQRSLFVGKRVRSETGLSIGASSVPSVAVTLAQRIFGTLMDRRVLVLGAGSVAELAVRHLQSQKVLSVSIANRTFENAVALARQFNASALTWEEGLRQLSQADIVVGSVAAPEPVVSAEAVRQALQARRGRSLLFMDLSMPRCIDPAIHNLDNVYLFNLEDLQSIVDENQARRASEIAKAERLIDEQARAFDAWLQAHREGRSMGLRHGPSSEPPPL